MKTSVIIPALDEAGNIATLVSEVYATVPVGVIVVDNGSTDETAVEARAAGRVVREPRRGYGYACAASVAAARAAEVLVFLDGDYSFCRAICRACSNRSSRGQPIWCWDRGRAATSSGGRWRPSSVSATD
jgi:hypothetical protein